MPTTLNEPYHLGIVVSDLEQAMRRYGEIYGIQTGDTDVAAR